MSTEALNTMGKYLDIATTRGAFNLLQCETILKAIRIFRPAEQTDTSGSDEEQTKALNVMGQFLNIATKKGVFDLTETKEITSAMEVFRAPKPEEI